MEDLQSILASLHQMESGLAPTNEALETPETLETTETLETPETLEALEALEALDAPEEAYDTPVLLQCDDLAALYETHESRGTVDMHLGAAVVIPWDNGYKDFKDNNNQAIQESKWNSVSGYSHAQKYKIFLDAYDIDAPELKRQLDEAQALLAQNMTNFQKNQDTNELSRLNKIVVNSTQAQTKAHKRYSAALKLQRTDNDACISAKTNYDSKHDAVEDISTLLDTTKDKLLSLITTIRIQCNATQQQLDAFVKLSLKRRDICDKHSSSRTDAVRQECRTTTGKYQQRASTVRDQLLGLTKHENQIKSLYQEIYLLLRQAQLNDEKECTLDKTIEIANEAAAKKAQVAPPPADITLLPVPQAQSPPLAPTVVKHGDIVPRLTKLFDDVQDEKRKYELQQQVQANALHQYNVSLDELNVGTGLLLSLAPENSPETIESSRSSVSVRTSQMNRDKQKYEDIHSLTKQSYDRLTKSKLHLIKEINSALSNSGSLLYSEQTTLERILLDITNVYDKALTDATEAMSMKYEKQRKNLEATKKRQDDLLPAHLALLKIKDYTKLAPPQGSPEKHSLRDDNQQSGGGRQFKPSRQAPPAQGPDFADAMHELAQCLLAHVYPPATASAFAARAHVARYAHIDPRVELARVNPDLHMLCDRVAHIAALAQNDKTIALAAHRLVLEIPEHSRLVSRALATQPEGATYAARSTRAPEHANLAHIRACLDKSALHQVRRCALAVVRAQYVGASSDTAGQSSNDYSDSKSVLWL
jgi:hypothetical protein